MMNAGWCACAWRAIGQSNWASGHAIAEKGLGEWDRAGADLHNQAGLNAFLLELEHKLPSNVLAHRIECHINDAEFADKALEIFDDWRAKGVIA